MTYGENTNRYQVLDISKFLILDDVDIKVGDLILVKASDVMTAFVDKEKNCMIEFVDIHDIIAIESRDGE
jgi:hypothetical protein